MTRQYYRKPREGTEWLVRLQRWPGLRARWASKSVRIYSNEHEAYWRPNAAGYTSDGLEAGVYAFEDAWARTKHCGPEKRITFREANGRHEPTAEETRA